MRKIDQVKYDLGQKAYVYAEEKVVECRISCIHITEAGVSYDTTPDEIPMWDCDDYIEIPQEYLFAKKSEAIAYAIEKKNALLQDAIRNLGIDELKKELVKAKKEEDQE